MLLTEAEIRHALEEYVEKYYDDFIDRDKYFDIDFFDHSGDYMYPQYVRVHFVSYN